MRIISLHHHNSAFYIISWLERVVKEIFEKNSKKLIIRYSSATPLTVKKKFWIKSGYSVIIIYNETVERGCDKWAEIMKKESITN